MSLRQLPTYVNEVFRDSEAFKDGLDRARSRTLACVNRHNPLPHQRCSILGHVNIGRLFNCSEPRDRVFALLGLMDSKVREKILVDYEKPVEEVYTEFTKVIVESSRSLEILVHAGLCRGASPCPTWVQDWNLLQPKSKQPKPLSYSNYSACCSIRPLGSMIRNNSQLAIRGVAVDSVLSTVPVPGDDLLADCSHHITGAKGLAIWRKYFAEYRTGCKPLHAWIRTVTADMDGSEITAGRLSQDLVQAYELEHQFRESPKEEQLVMMRAEGPEIDNWVEWFLAISNRFHLAVIATSVNRTFFISTKGYMGMGPVAMNEGDVICVVLGCNVPLVLRKEGDYYLWLGSASSGV